MDNVNKKSKFSRQLRNRLNQSLTIINILSLDAFKTNYSEPDTPNISTSNSSYKSDTNFDNISYNDNHRNHDIHAFINSFSPEFKKFEFW